MDKDKSELDNVIFLDFDGVINIKSHYFNGTFENQDAIYYLNKLCLETGFKIVVCSSWRNHMDYKEFLYNSGLDKSIEILGKTGMSHQGKEFEIKRYLDEHLVNKFIVIDDAYFSGEMAPYHIQTAPTLGFTENKYKEALDKISKL